jgi:serine/threonine protein kinase
MPYVRGESLRARLTQGPVPLAEAVAVLRDVATALDYAHGQHLVHRDIKPENVLLSGRTAVVTDFGIAKALQASRTQAPDGPAGAAAMATLTQRGTSLGTPSRGARRSTPRTAGRTGSRPASPQPWVTPRASPAPSARTRRRGGGSARPTRGSLR